ncbi:uncharacterized protein LOC115743869 [Rhodamnia argentea]|uniref:Uncharacterized protein LOC115743869 n=1 Tax=Rhodamnia argentea TaxID=178133 RepID=A0ABM3HBZ0_9MYRT|nr:uncharacterized protein LOC115743869 [Rhodamnia argentea]
MAVLLTSQKPILDDMRKPDLEVLIHHLGTRLANLRVQPTLIERIKAKQNDDPQARKIREGVEAERREGFSIHANESPRFRGQLCVPDDSELKKEILREAHSTRFSIHPRNTKMYIDPRENFWWINMKKDVVKFVDQCLVCQQVKIEHQKPGGQLHPLEIPKCKLGLSLEDMAKRYVNEIVKLHGVPVSIVFDRDPRFVSNFWKSIQRALGTRLNFSTTFHP